MEEDAIEDLNLLRSYNWGGVGGRVKVWARCSGGKRGKEGI